MTNSRFLGINFYFIFMKYCKYPLNVNDLYIKDYWTFNNYNNIILFNRYY